MNCKYRCAPELEIVSINPINLKNVFKDEYTKDFLDDHPEINPKDVDILDGKCL